jgi:hypothetical protein
LYGWAKTYFLREKTPPPWLCILIILILNFQLKDIITELSVFALLTALTTKYNFIFLIPFYPSPQFLPVSVVTFTAALLSCNRKWKLYMHLFSLSVVYLEQPEILTWAVAGNTLFLAVTVFKKCIF